LFYGFVIIMMFTEGYYEIDRIHTLRASALFSRAVTTPRR
jgi:hypothetical protein